MQAYGSSFARVYNLRWSGFASQISPRICSYYESTTIGQESRHILDLCCGTGQLAMYFLDQGYTVTGLDLSEAMLEYARINNAAYIVAGLASFVRNDAASFHFDDRFGLVVSTFDALNHLPDFQSLTSCFSSVINVLEEGGLFIFDLNTLKSLQRWTGISVNDTPEMMLVIRSLFDPNQQKAYTNISGFLPSEGGLWERFEETAYNTAFPMNAVQQALLNAGFRSAKFVRDQDFNHQVADPEQEMRIFIIAEK